MAYLKNEGLKINTCDIWGCGTGELYGRESLWWFDGSLKVYWEKINECEIIEPYASLTKSKLIISSDS